MEATIEHTVTIVLEECCACGVIFGMPKNLQKQLRESHDSFYCPTGHKQHYTDSPKDREIERLKKQLKYAEEDVASWCFEAEAKAKSLAATKGALTKMKKRVDNGVCPYCNRQFVNLQRHMEGQHHDQSGT